MADLIYKGHYVGIARALRALSFVGKNRDFRRWLDNVA